MAAANFQDSNVEEKHTLTEENSLMVSVRLLKVEIPQNPKLLLLLLSAYSSKKTTNFCPNATFHEN